MKRLILLLILLSIAVTAPISAEEIRLTTIVPDQTVLRAKKGVIGNTYYTAISDVSIPTNALLVEGNVGIGTSTPSPTTKLEVNGVMRLAPTAQPASPQPGMIYYDSSTNPDIMKYYNGTTWVDMGGGGGGAFGVWDSLNSQINDGIDHQAATDCIIVAYVENCSDLRGYTNLFPVGPLDLVAAVSSPLNVQETRCITFPVRKNDYYRVTAVTAPFANKVLWLLHIGN